MEKKVQYLFQGVILLFGWPQINALASITFLLLFARNLLDVAAMTETPDRAGQPFLQCIPRALGPRGAALQGVQGWLWLQCGHGLRLAFRTANCIVFCRMKSGEKGE